MRSLVLLLFLTPAAFAGHVHSEFANDFGARILHETAKAEDGVAKNRLVSPVANHLAWSMLLNGTAGPTHDALIDTLTRAGRVPALTVFNEGARECQRQLVTLRREDEQFPHVTISNGAWMSTGKSFAFNAGYGQTLNEFFGAEINAIDFRDPNAASSINGWFERKTEGLISNVVSPSDVAKLLFLLANATYFEGTWAHEFRAFDVTERFAPFTGFTLGNGTEVHRSTIVATEDFRHVRDQMEEIIEIPFLNEDPAAKEFVFYAVLPGPGHDVAEYRSPGAWERVAHKLGSVELEPGFVSLPKFAFDYGYEALSDSPLAVGLGLNHLFQDSADLSALKTPESVAAKVGLFKSVNRIELDEKGVKAAAAVVVGAVAMGVPPQDFEMMINRPFAFAIAEKVSGALVFLGEVHDPQ